MITKAQIREIAFKNGVNLFGVASVGRFDVAPKGFHPTDVYSKAKTVIAFAIKLPSEALYAENPVPYTHVNTIAVQKMDLITYDISCELEKFGLKN